MQPIAQRLHSLRKNAVAASTARRAVGSVPVPGLRETRATTIGIEASIGQSARPADAALSWRLSLPGCHGSAVRARSIYSRSTFSAQCGRDRLRAKVAARRLSPLCVAFRWHHRRATRLPRPLSVRYQLAIASRRTCHGKEVPRFRRNAELLRFRANDADPIRQRRR
jgi:hypothetical protein